MKLYGVLSGTGDIHAGYFYGDGSNLTGIAGGSSNHALLSNLAYASSGHTGFMPVTGGTFTGDVFFGAQNISGTGNIYASAFYGDGSNLTGVSGAGVSAHSSLTELDYASAGHTGFLPATSGTDIQNQLNGKSSTGHIHDDRYYTESEVNTISGALSVEIDSDISTHTSNANAHHAQSHTIVSHSDTSAAGSELDTLTDGSNADLLHSHTISGTSISGGDHSTLINIDYASAGHTGFLPSTSGTDIQNQINTKLENISGENHSTLNNLDYASAGHTGFLPSTSGTDIQNQLNTKMPLAGGTFTGDVSMANGIDILATVSGTSDLGTAALPFQNIYADTLYGSSLSLQEDITFTGATAVNLINIPDNLADALSIKEGSNSYVQFITTDGDEDILFSKPVDIHHTAVMADDHAVEIDVNAAAYGDVKALDIDYITGNIITGKDEGVILVNIDETLATGGEVFALEILSTDGGADGIHALKAGPEIHPIHHDSGTFVDPTLATDNTSGTDVPVMRDGILGNTTTIFEDQNEYIIIGYSSAYQDLELVFSTAATKNINPTFWYSTGGAGYTQFTPVDGTDGCKHTGVISWDASDLAGHVANATGTFDIKMVRTRNNMTAPVLGYAKIATTTEYTWDKDGNVSINSLAIAGNVTLATGEHILAAASGTSNIGSASIPFGNVYCDDLRVDDNIYVEDVTTNEAATGGIIVTMTVDANTTGFGAALHMDTDGNWIEADATVSGTMSCQAMALETGTGSKEVLMQGFVRDDSWAWTIGGNIYIGNTAGTLTQTTPNESGEIVQAVGFATHADRMYFNPDYTYVEIA